jgi:anaerobic dimethyl sulfoxide reductase subunit B (iron-sulfur subunit)
MSSSVTQYGFFFDQSRCVHCFACQAACKAKNNIPPGSVRWLRLFNWETGSFPDVAVNTLFAPCYHCANPVCVTAAGDGSLIKEPKYGAVLIDPAKATSPALRAANEACPYGAIMFDSAGTASKCNMCVDRLEKGQLPSCVLSCPTRALDFGKITDLQAKYGTVADLPDVPSSSTTKPAVVFKARTPRKQVVPYDSTAALQLLQNRGSLPQVFTDPSQVTDLTGVTVGRSKLDMHASGQDLIDATQDNYG